MPIFTRTDRLRLRRHVRRQQRQANTQVQRAGEQFEANFIDRLDSVLDSRRFVASWLALAILMVGLTLVQSLNLSALYQKSTPAQGGVYTEGMVGTYSGANPIFATGAVDSSVSKLIFAGLLTYDNENQLVGDIAEGYTQDDSGRVYTLKLKQNVLWHDGIRLTADDVVFTYKLIQNPEVKSPKFTGWQGIEVSKLDDFTVQFVLKNALTSFPHGLTTGILPEHIVGRIEPGALRASSFNTTQPVGAGPFKWNGLQLSSATAVGSSTGIISMEFNPTYHKNRPMLDGFNLHTYENEEQLLAAYNKKTISAVAGLKEVPETIEDDGISAVHRFRTTASVMVFLKNDGVLADAKVRSALNYATNKQAIYEELSSDIVPVRTPILRGQVGYNSAYVQPQQDLAKAQQLLDEAGWKKGADGVRSKDGLPLSFRLYAETSPANDYILESLEKQWADIGVDMMPVSQSNIDFQVTLQIHSYDALLHGISIGADPDVYAYWHSSQADSRLQNRLNFSEYKSKVADEALEAGRTRSDPKLRPVKYEPFLKAWVADTPAISLYEPKILYVTRGEIYGIKDDRRLNTDVDRYNNVHEWATLKRQITQ
jgi:peptide/nickel transport system substrate-binding protein